MKITDMPSMEDNRDAMKEVIAYIALAGFLIAAASGLLEAASGPGNRFGIWGFRQGLAIFRWAAYGALLGLVTSLAALVASLVYRPKPSCGLIPATIGVAAGAVGTALPLIWLSAAMSVPPIHDITTDTADPPAFAALLEVRKGAVNGPEYGGEAVAQLQKKAYPWIVPLETKTAPDRAYEASLKTAKDDMCWVIVDANAREGRIEATDTTFWFGFKDDIVVRVTALPSGSKVDVRSVSRVGRSDVGTNARRIRRYLEKLKRNLGQ